MSDAHHQHQEHGVLDCVDDATVPHADAIEPLAAFESTGRLRCWAAVNSDYSFVAEVGNRERFREYDYGPGLGAGVEAVLTRKGQPLLTFLYRYQWIDVSNGSVFNKGDEIALRNGNTVTLEGSDASHTLQGSGLRLFVPIFRKMGLGADGFDFLRKSRYDLPIFKDVDQRNPEFRAYLAFDLGR